MSIHRKVLFGVGLSSILIVTAFVVGLRVAADQRVSIHSVQTLTEQLGGDLLTLVDATAAMKLDVVQVQQFLTDVSATRGLDGLDDGTEKAAEFARKFGDDVARGRAAAQRLGYRDIVAAVDDAVAAFGPYYETGKSMAKLYILEGPAGGNAFMGVFDKTSAEIAGRLDVVLEATARHASQIGTDAREHALEAEHGGALALLNLEILGAVVVGLLLLGGIALLRGVTGPMERLAADMAAIAGGDLDRAIEGAGRRDELGRMAASLDGFRMSQRALGALRQETVARDAAAEATRRQTLKVMADSLEETVSSAVEAIRSSAQEMRGEAQSLASAASQASSRADGVSLASERAADNVGGVAASTVQLAAAIADINRQVHDARTASATAVVEVKDTDKAMAQLGEAVQRIRDIVQTIAGIARQTNLLALNASVEAARAGHAGLGFAVVAREVGNLASDVENSANEIKRQVDGIQGAVGQVTAAVVRVGSSIHRIDEISVAIAAGVEQQRAATENISANVQNAAAGTQEVSGHIAVVGAAANQTGQAAERMLGVATLLSDESGHLDRAVHRFIDRVRAA